MPRDPRSLPVSNFELNALVLADGGERARQSLISLPIAQNDNEGETVGAARISPVGVAIKVGAVGLGYCVYQILGGALDPYVPTSISSWVVSGLSLASIFGFLPLKPVFERTSSTAAPVAA